MRAAEQAGSFVDLAVRSFVLTVPPSRLVVPADATVDFIKRQIQYRCQVLTPDACTCLPGSPA